jgi:hypothetical protein
MEYFNLIFTCFKQILDTGETGETILRYDGRIQINIIAKD